MSSLPDPSTPSPWHELEMEANAQLSALSVMIASGQNPWSPEEAAQRGAEALARQIQQADAAAMELQRRMAALQATAAGGTDPA